MTTKSINNPPIEIVVEETANTIRSVQDRRTGDGSGFIRCRRKPAKRRKQKDIFKQV